MRNRVVLVADTNVAFVDLLREELSSTAYVLLHAKDGQEAIEYFELLESHIDVVIINMELSLGTGAVRRIPKRKQAMSRRIIWTRTTDVRFLKPVKPLGADAVARIPIPMQEWHTAITAVLSGSSNRGPKARLLAIPAVSKITEVGYRKTAAPTEAM